MEPNGTADCVLIIIAVIFPPVAVAIVSGCSCDLFVNILLTLLGYLPGLIHALWLVLRRINVPERRAVGSYRYTGTPTQAPEPGAPQTPGYGATNQSTAPQTPGYGATDQSTAPQPPTYPTPQPTTYQTPQPTTYQTPQPTTYAATAQPVDAPPPVGKN